MSRRLFACITAVMLLIEVLFPPYDPPRGWSSYPMVFAFLFSPPEIQRSGDYGTVNLAMLAIELVATFATGWLLIRFVAKE